jgi:SAM-dependent methyltransferase
MIKGLAPGTILQFIFIRNRLLKNISKGKKFLEIGSGNGHLSNLLLKIGYVGQGIDLNESACENNKTLNQKWIENGNYIVHNKDFNTSNFKEFDFVISSMVLEHLANNELKIFIQNAINSISNEGKLIFLVPSNMSAWGIEDEIAGHVKRYTFNDIAELAKDNGLNVDYKCGLNYPVSNLLLSLSNRIVKKNESSILDKNNIEKTVYTGNRVVKYKTVFPTYLNILLNEISLLPFHLMQLANLKNEKSLVMYFELSKKN